MDLQINEEVIEKYFNGANCVVKKNVLLAIIDLYKKVDDGWADSAYVMQFIKDNDSGLYSKSAILKSGKENRSLSLSISSNLQLSTKSGLTEKNSNVGVKQYRLKPDFKDSIDALESYIESHCKDI